MSNNSNKLRENEEKRDELIKEMMTQKYNYIEITDKDKKANELYHSKVETNFKFQDDFYYNLAMKYKLEIESNEFFKDLKYMPKGCLLHHHMVDCIDITWLSEIVMRKEYLKNIYMRKFRGIYDILIYTKSPNLEGEEPDKQFKDIIEKYLAENKGKTPYDYFYSKLSMDPEEIAKALSSSK